MTMSIVRNVCRLFRPCIDGLLGRNIPWTLRWRLFAMQPLAFITFAVHSLPYLFSRLFKSEWISVATGATLRVIVFKDENSRHDRPGKLRPLHLDIHGGAFIGGQPEEGAPFCWKLAQQTGTVVISISYRFAPRHPFPAAIDDVDAMVKYIQENAAEKWGADPQLMTVSGWSAGGNLALAAAQHSNCHLPAKTAFKGAVLFILRYERSSWAFQINLNLAPGEKPVPKDMPRDPMPWLQPLFDAYAGPARTQNRDNPRLSPYVSPVHTLPEAILFVVPHLDILVHEQLSFVERVKNEIRKNRDYEGRRVEALYVEHPMAFHGYLNLPASVIGRELHDRAFDAGIALISDVHRKHGWNWG